MLPEAAEGPGVQDRHKESPNRAGTIPASRKKKALAVPGFHLEHEIFPLVSYKLHHGEYISPNRRAGEDLTSCLAHLQAFARPRATSVWHVPKLTFTDREYFP